MKKLACVIIAAVVGFAATVPASAQLKFGLKAGVAVNNLKFDKDIVKADNRAGFTGGAMLEFTVPVVGVGLDASVMYVHRSVDKGFFEDIKDFDGSRDYIDIPINLKWKINLPVVSSILKPYIATGPAFAFLVSKNDFKEFIDQKKCDISWNFGVGLEFFSHLQVGASYGLGLTNALEKINVADGTPIEGKNKYWTITAAYLF
ncbi:MAG TPA: porin family protein [Candidatus Limisoma intestinavium]|uniref:Porin family protein n=1 Tax=Candidatus Limisoma intestinavium TaxID=2840856 RepID=A0A9D1IL04_9BACT|nr:porin family protein [Candidatus Limisoma intestinavium]